MPNFDVFSPGAISGTWPPPSGTTRRSKPTWGQSSSSVFGQTDTRAPQTVQTPGTSSAFNLNPIPTQGYGAYGAVPGQLGLPDPFADLQIPIPGLPGLNSAASSALLSKLTGSISPETQNLIQDAAARFGVSSGMPGSGLARNRTVRDLGLTSEALQREGLSAYGPFVGAVSQTQTVNPALKNEIALQNSVNAAAPNPTAAASEAKNLFNQYLNRMAQSSRGPNAGTSGGGAGSGGFPSLNPAGATGRGTGLVPQVGTTGGVGTGYGYSHPSRQQVYGTDTGAPNYGLSGDFGGGLNYNMEQPIDFIDQLFPQTQGPDFWQPPESQTYGPDFWQPPATQTLGPDFWQPPATETLGPDFWQPPEFDYSNLYE